MIDFQVNCLSYYSTLKKLMIIKAYLLAFLIVGITSDLVIRSPLTLKKYFTDKYGVNSTGIPYSLANFGDVPYGRSIVG